MLFTMEEFYLEKLRNKVQADIYILVTDSLLKEECLVVKKKAETEKIRFGTFPCKEDRNKEDCDETSGLF